MYQRILMRYINLYIFLDLKANLSLSVSLIMAGFRPNEIKLFPGLVLSIVIRIRADEMLF